MKKRIIVKILLDALMAFSMIALMFGYATTPLFHEVLGILIGVFFLGHVALNYREAKGLLKSLFNGKLKGKRRVNAILDLGLMVLMPVDVISGIIISRALFTTTYNEALVGFHNIVSWVVLATIVSHLFLHVPYLKGVGNSIKRRSARPAINLSALFGAIMLIGGMVYGSFAYVLNAEQAALASTTNDDTATDTEDTSTTTDDSSTSSTTDDDDDDDTDSNTIDATVITLDDYLGGLTCTGCHRHCSLLYPQCGVGVNQAEQAEVEYDNLYGDSESQSLVATDDGTATTDDSSTTTTDDDNETDDSSIPTLMEYLNTFNCSACGRHCSLASPQCGRGEQQAEIQTEEYNELYSVSS